MSETYRISVEQTFERDFSEAELERIEKIGDSDIAESAIAQAIIDRYADRVEPQEKLTDLTVDVTESPNTQDEQ